jgi:radical SAM superfamily enzyme YgiQ (UPF0313 family)
MSLNILIVVPALRKKVSFYPPFGAMSVIAATREENHNAQLLDLDARRCSINEAIESIKEFSPDVVGISAVVATSYKYVKDLTKLIREQLPNVVIVVGGGLAAAGEILLQNSCVDFLVHGEGEITFKELIKNIENGLSYESVNGISYKENGKVIKNDPRPTIKELDLLPFPDYDLIDLNKYILNIHEFLKTGYGEASKIDKRVSESNRPENFLRINISRGCVNKCTFCYRNMPGIRINSMEYIGNLIEHVTIKYNIGHISFADECFGPTKRWLWGFVDMIKKRGFDLTYHITGMRVRIVDLEIMKALKELGVWHIQFGFESGSQKILNIMEKNTTVEQNISAALFCKEVGINTIPFIIIGYPGETIKTLYETIDFLKRADLLSQNFRPNFPLAIPGTPLFEYAKLKGFITDTDKYLETISDTEANELTEDNYFINYTQEPTSDVMAWMILIKKEVNKYFGNSLSFSEIIQRVFREINEHGVVNTISFIFKSLIYKVNSGKIKRRYNQDFPRKDCSEEENTYLINKGESLRVINKRLKGSMKGC